MTGDRIRIRGKSDMEKQITEESPVTASIAKETPSRMSCTSPNVSNTAKSGMITVRDLLQGRSAEHQYKILMLADRILPSGRYYGGGLSPEQIQALEDSVKEHKRDPR